LGRANSIYLLTPRSCSNADNPDSSRIVKKTAFRPPVAESFMTAYTQISDSHFGDAKSALGDDLREARASIGRALTRKETDGVSGGAVVAQNTDIAQSTVAAQNVVEKRSIGDVLRTTRGGLGLTLVDAERDLRIKENYLHAIEDCDTQRLPNPVYSDGFVKTYASYLGLDPDQTLERFHQESAGSSGLGRKKKAAALGSTVDPLAAFDRKPTGRTFARGFAGLIGALWPFLLIGVLAVAGWFGVQMARDAGVFPENLSVIGAVDPSRSNFDASIENQGDGEVGLVDGVAPERPSELAYADPGEVPYWRGAPEAAGIDGPISAIDGADAGLLPNARLAPNAAFDAESGLAGDLANRVDETELSALSSAVGSSDSDNPLGSSGVGNESSGASRDSGEIDSSLSAAGSTVDAVSSNRSPLQLGTH